MPDQEMQMKKYKVVTLCGFKGSHSELCSAIRFSRGVRRTGYGDPKL